MYCFAQLEKDFGKVASPRHNFQVSQLRQQKGLDQSIEDASAMPEICVKGGTKPRSTVKTELTTSTG